MAFDRIGGNLFHELVRHSLDYYSYKFKSFNYVRLINYETMAKFLLLFAKKNKLLQQMENNFVILEPVPYSYEKNITFCFNIDCCK